ncbi:MAG: hypothetical protein KGL69_05500, partial [Alphaproteobacteria bacterium]|nr:hypothetical protein [Alphaproteobacteria bacterium]
MNPIRGGPSNRLAQLLSVLTAFLAALCFWRGAAGGASPFFYGLGAILVVLAVLIPQSLMMANVWE